MEGSGTAQREATVRPVRVVTQRVIPKGSFQVQSTQDQDVVEAFPACRSHPSLGERVRLWCSDRRLDDSDTLGAEDLVERTRELGVSVSDHEPGVSKPRLRPEVAGLLRHPRGIGFPGDPEDVDTPGPELDGE